MPLVHALCRRWAGSQLALQFERNVASTNVWLHDAGDLVGRMLVSISGSLRQCAL